MASARELAEARAELNRVNKELGIARRVPQDPPSGGPEHPTGGENHAQPPADSLQGASGGDKPGETPKDPGPPRFLGVDLENKLAGLSGGGIIPVRQVAHAKIVGILLGELRASLDNTLKVVSATHKQRSMGEQIDIPFKEAE